MKYLPFTRFQVQRSEEEKLLSEELRNNLSISRVAVYFVTSKPLLEIMLICLLSNVDKHRRSTEDNNIAKLE